MLQDFFGRHSWEQGVAKAKGKRVRREDRPHQTQDSLQQIATAVSPAEKRQALARATTKIAAGIAEVHDEQDITEREIHLMANQLNELQELVNSLKKGLIFAIILSCLLIGEITYRFLKTHQ